MAAPKYPDLCPSCYFEGREPAICEDCHKGSNYDPAEGDEDALDELKGITFYDDWKDAA
jgi:hypothetical protein